VKNEVLKLISVELVEGVWKKLDKGGSSWVEF
jgi:hypothetical protein